LSSNYGWWGKQKSKKVQKRVFESGSTIKKSEFVAGTEITRERKRNHRGRGTKERK